MACRLIKISHKKALCRILGAQNSCMIDIEAWYFMHSREHWDYLTTVRKKIFGCVFSHMVIIDRAGFCCSHKDLFLLIYKKMLQTQLLFVNFFLFFFFVIWTFISRRAIFSRYFFRICALGKKCESFLFFALLCYCWSLHLLLWRVSNTQ